MFEIKIVCHLIRNNLKLFKLSIIINISSLLLSCSSRQCPNQMMVFARIKLKY